METKTEKLPITKKKQIYVGTKELVDTETGEIYPVQLKQVEERDFNFTKVWLQMFINGLENIANKKMRLAFWIIDHLDSENKLVFTFRRMAEETGLSYPTVVRTMKELQQGDVPFLRKLQSGAYIINPDIMYKGSHQSRMGIIYKFGNVPTKDLLKKKQKLDEHEKAKAKSATDTTATNVNNAEIDDTVKTSETTTTETTVANTMTETTTTESAIETTTQMGRRTGRAGTPKPVNWEQIKAKILNGELSRSQFCKDNHISVNTLRKWLNEND